MIDGSGLVKRWGATTALDGAEIRVGSGITGLVGPNGAGKTTLFSLILGLHQPEAGSLTVLGSDPARSGAAVRALIGYSPEHHDLPDDVNAVDLVRHMGQVHGLPATVAKARASDALWQVGLGEERIRPIGTMSTGQRQRVKLAQAIVHDPKLLILDEPTDGLDPVQRDDMLELLARIGREFDMVVLLSSHILDEVERVCDAVVILNEGRTVASGPLEELRIGGHGLVVEVVEEASSIARRLRGAGATVVEDGLRLLVNGEDDLDISRLVRDAVAAEHAGLRSLRPSTMSLEEVFLEAELGHQRALGTAT